MKSYTSSTRKDPARAYARLVQSLCNQLHLSEELSNNVIGLARSRSYGKLVALADSIASQQYGDAAEHLRMNQLALFISKVPFEDRSLDPRATALKKFWASEHRMQRVNAKFRILRRRFAGYTQDPIPQGSEFLHFVREKIRRVLGDLDLSEVYSECYLGDGSAVGCRGSYTHIVQKMRAPSYNPASEPYVVAMLQNNAVLRDLSHGGRFSPFTWFQSSRVIHWLAERGTKVSHNIVDFVPKNAKTHRTIALEPSLSGALQLGIGKVIQRKLLRVGIDLTDQSKNQRYAKYGSTFWDDAASIATIDLSSASDSISSELVRLVFPPDWVELMDACRSPAFELDGNIHRYEKYSTMGNGFTFPLQTLLYWAICQSALKETGETLCAVYGDDIAVPKGTALLVIERLRYCGFRVNVDKTFIAGPFRESCGCDYFAGRDVRPFVLDFLPQDNVDLIKVANGISEVFGYSSFVETCLELMDDNRRYVKPHLTGAVDDAVHVPLDVFMASRFARWDLQRQTWNFKVFRSNPGNYELVSDELEQVVALTDGCRNPVKGSGTLQFGPPVKRWSEDAGKPASPCRFTARVKGNWYLPVLKT